VSALLQQVDTWVCGSVAWLVAELGKADAAGEMGWVLLDLAQSERVCYSLCQDVQHVMNHALLWMQHHDAVDLC
jgi:hypothetical protein